MAIIKINDLNNVEFETYQVNNDFFLNIDKTEIYSVTGGCTFIFAPTIAPVIIIGDNNHVNLFSYFNYNNQGLNNFSQSASGFQQLQSGFFFG